MPQYIGFSTINANKPQTTNDVSGIDGGVGGIRKPVIWGKKFRLTDEKLVIQDFINALNITKGSKVGQPGYGTTLWTFVFEPNTTDVQNQLENEIKRVASQDPRLAVNYVRVFPQENGILIEVELYVVPFNQSQVVNVFFNNQTNTAIQF